MNWSVDSDLVEALDEDGTGDGVESNREVEKDEGRCVPFVHDEADVLGGSDEAGLNLVWKGSRRWLAFRWSASQLVMSFCRTLAG